MGPIVEFTKEHCVQFTATNSALDFRNIAFPHYQSGGHPEAAEQLHDLDFQHTPVVRAEDHEPWSGFQLETTATLYREDAVMDIKPPVDMCV